ncbi:uncharacterized protein LOC144421986 [Styela clava]
MLIFNVIVILHLILLFGFRSSQGCFRDRFRCLDGKSCIMGFCDGHPDCLDGSDERDSMAQRIGEEIFCDGVFSTRNPKRCLLPEHYMCDGIDHCVGGSKHHLKSMETLRDLPRQRGKPITDVKSDCVGHIDEINCPEIQCKEVGLQTCNYKCRGPNAFTNVDLYATQCDGKITCPGDIREECGCPSFAPFCHHVDSSGLYNCPSTNPVTFSRICNGVKDCRYGEEEVDCFHRFYCLNESPLHIDENEVCNGRKDCSDSSDEVNCSPQTHFYCNDGGKQIFIVTEQICDGIQDCASGNDECFNRCITSVFADVTSMIKNKILVAITWIIAIMATSGNIIVIGMSIRTLCFNDKQVKKMGKVALENKLLLCNLAVSDFFVGIYTLAICIRAEMMKGNYCLADKAWRSGSSCSLLGAFFVIGSESSVLTLVILNVYRVYGILRPFEEISLRFTGFLMAMSWIVSSIIAIVPVLPFTEDYFVDRAWSRNNPFFSTITKSEIGDINKWLISTENFDGSTKSSRKNKAIGKKELRKRVRNMQKKITTIVVDNYPVKLRQLNLLAGLN